MLYCRTEGGGKVFLSGYEKIFGWFADLMGGGK